MPLKCLSNFWRKLDILLTNCEVPLSPAWSESCVITSNATRKADPDADPEFAGINNRTGASFKITDCILYFPVMSLSAENDNKLLKQLKT